MPEIMKIDTTAKLIAVAILFLVFNYAVPAQTSEFTYQGKLNDSSSLANGQYDFSFKLYDSSNIQIGSVVVRDDVPVTNGVFAVSLDFGAASFNGVARFLEISVRPAASTGAYTTLAPKQAVTSAPYAVKSLSAATADSATNATQLGGVNAGQFVQTSDSRMTDARNPMPNSPSYIQNTTAAQASSNFNISGDGAVGGTLSGNTVNAATQYNIAGQRALLSDSRGVYAGLGAGQNIPASGTFGLNAFVGQNAGASTTAGNSNSFFGNEAGLSNVIGSYNAFFGNQAGRNTTNSQNAFFGHAAGFQNTTGFQNAFFGTRAGGGSVSITGGQNSLFGYHTGWNITSGSGNTLIGASTDVATGAVTNGTAIGTGAIVAQDNSVILGSSSARVGIGVSAPANKLQIIDPANTGLRVQNTISGGTVASFGVNGDFNIDSASGAGGRLNIKENGKMTLPGPMNVGGATIISGCPSCFDGLVPDRLVVDGTERLMLLGAAGSTALCRNASYQISSCSSSLRYKTDITPYRPGLDLVRKLQPISFRWKADGMPDLGLGAETVAKVEPLLVTNNDSGEVEGVKYDRVAVVLLNAVKEQQAQIEKQQQQIDVLRREVVSLRRAASSRRKRK